MEAAKQIHQGFVRSIRVYPDPILKRRCLEVLAVDDRVLSVVDDLIETMLSLPRCVGLAAPQIGEAKRIVVVDVSRHPKAPPKNHGMLCMINPVIQLRHGVKISREGCVSVPDLTANVTRAENIAVSFLDCFGHEKWIETNAFESVAIQHEIDHLDGMLFLDRVSATDLFKRKQK